MTLLHQIKERAVNEIQKVGTFQNMLGYRKELNKCMRFADPKKKKNLENIEGIRSVDSVCHDTMSECRVLEEIGRESITIDMSAGTLLLVI